MNKCILNFEKFVQLFLTGELKLILKFLFFLG